jgi:hypothetical protein
MTSPLRNTLREGVVAGLTGFGTVAAVLALLNLISGRSPFHTAEILGSALLGRPSAAVPSSDAIMLYSVVHLAVFIAFGLVAAWLARLADRGWQLWFVALFFFIFISFHLFAAVQALATPGRAMIADATVWGAGVAAAALMALYLVWAHPRARATQRW